jgi:PAS domain S-box-containing protein
MEEKNISKQSEIENLRLQNKDLRDTLDQITVLQSLTQDINRSKTLDQIVETVLQIIPQILECLSCQIFLYKEEKFQRIGLKQFIENIPLLEVDENTMYWGCKRGVISVLPGEITGHGQAVVPLVDHGRIMGCILIDLGRYFESYNATLGLLLNTMANHVSLAVSHDQNQEQLKKEIKEHSEVRQYFDKVIDSITHSLFSLDSDGVITLINPRAEEFFEVREKFARGNPYSLIFPEKVKQVLDGLLATVQKGLEPLPQEVTFTTPFKSQRHGLISAALIQSPSSLKPGMVCICEDLSVSAELEHQKELITQRNDFFNMVTREVQKPLRMVMEQWEKVAGSVSPSMGQPIQEGLHKINQVVQDVIDLAKLEMKQLPFKNESFSLEDCLKKVYEKYKPRADHKGLKFEIYIDEKVGNLLGDSEKFIQVLSNMVSNAIKYTYSGKVEMGVCYFLEDKNESLQVYCKDTGCGLEEVDFPKVFDRYTRVDNAQAEIGGIGLGMPLSQEILKFWNTKMKIESQVGVGSKFYFHLPLT